MRKPNEADRNFVGGAGLENVGMDCRLERTLDDGCVRYKVSIKYSVLCNIMVDFALF